MTTSWLAEQKATMSASSAVAHGAVAGSAAPNASRLAINAPCVASIQPRRRPNSRVRPGKGRRSMRGAHRNLME